MLVLDTSVLPGEPSYLSSIDYFLDSTYEPSHYVSCIYTDDDLLYSLLRVVNSSYDLEKGKFVKKSIV